jgi:hypothetical protein
VIKRTNNKLDSQSRLDGRLLQLSHKIYFARFIQCRRTKVYYDGMGYFLVTIITPRGTRSTTRIIVVLEINPNRLFVSKYSSVFLHTSSL